MVSVVQVLRRWRWHGRDQGRLAARCGRSVACFWRELAPAQVPGPAPAGSEIKGADQDFGPDVVVFVAGATAGPGGELLAGGGRALNVCALGEDLAQARERAYGAVALIDWPQGFHRTDIGWRALHR